MNDKKIRKLVLAALLAALVCVATMVVQIPSPMQGYVNLGDCSGHPGHQGRDGAGRCADV